MLQLEWNVHGCAKTLKLHFMKLLRLALKSEAELHTAQVLPTQTADTVATDGTCIASNKPRPGEVEWE